MGRAAAHSESKHPTQSAALRQGFLAALRNDHLHSFLLSTLCFRTRRGTHRSLSTAAIQVRVTTGAGSRDFRSGNRPGGCIIGHDDFAANPGIFNSRNRFFHADLHCFPLVQAGQYDGGFDALRCRSGRFRQNNCRTRRCKSIYVASLPDRR